MNLQYSFGGEVRYNGQVPESATLDSDGVITGILSDNLASPSNWSEPPHIALANMAEDARAAVAFTKRYGPLFKPVEGSADGWRAIGQDGVSSEESALSPEDVSRLRRRGISVEGPFSLGLDRFFDAQNRLRLAWRGERSNLETFRGEISNGNYRVDLLPAPQIDEVILYSDDLWQFIRFTFLIDYDTGKARICANDRCKRPYFLQQRSDQECCSHSCAVERNNARRAAQRRTNKTTRR